MEKVLEQNIHTAARCLKALAHPTRLRILSVLDDREMGVQQIVDELKTSQSSVSQQLGLLKDRHVLESRREGNQVFYRVRDRKILKLLDLMREVFCPPPH
jgi:DNA-binding transcriptional ArsR family regulator